MNAYERDIRDSKRIEQANAEYDRIHGPAKIIQLRTSPPLQPAPKKQFVGNPKPQKAKYLRRATAEFAASSEIGPAATKCNGSLPFHASGEIAPWE